MMIVFRDGKVNLKAGEMFVMPKGVEHKPVAERECKIMLVELAGTINIGDEGGGNYQTLINIALREYINSKSERLEETLRHVIREELSAYGKKSKS